jgi:hypothetical protein
MTTSRTTRDKTPAPAPTSITFNSEKELNAIRAAARRVGKSVSRYAREVLLEHAAHVLGHCPHCGSAKHSAAA